MREEIGILKKTHFNKTLKKITDKYKNRKILLYGMGRLGETVIKNYNLSELNIIGVSDKKFSDTDFSEYLGYKAYKVEELNTIGFDVIIVTLLNAEKVIQMLVKQFPDAIIIDALNYTKCTTLSVSRFKQLIKRNFDRIATNYITDNKLFNSFWAEEIKELVLLREKLSYLLTKKVSIPQVEFAITTKCTLKCQSCLNYIPDIKKDEHIVIPFEDFKTYVNNLLNAVNSVKKLILIGGEPLLIPNLFEYAEFAARKSRVKQVWIFTNGTMLFNDNLLKICKKYKNKIKIYISNYSQNSELSNILKYQAIFKQLEENHIYYEFDSCLLWEYCTPLNEIKKQNCCTDYFEKCTNPCVSVFGNKMFVCPRAGVFSIKNLYNPKEYDYVDLANSDSEFLSNKIIEFYSQNYFTACQYCTVLEDKTQPLQIPAIQRSNNNEE